MKIFIYSILLASFVFIATHCSSPSRSGTTEASVAESEETLDPLPVMATQAVCLWESLSVRAEPKDNAKYLTAIYKGETVDYMEDTVTDLSSDKKNLYAKVVLTDGTEGWVLYRFLAIDAEPAVTVEEALIYRRPDLLTASDKSFSRMDLVAIKSIQDDWIEVTGKPAGENWFSEGWIKASQVSREKVDISFALLYQKAQNAEENQEGELERVLSNEALQSSRFYSELTGEKVAYNEPFKRVLDCIISGSFVDGLYMVEVGFGGMNWGYTERGLYECIPDGYEEDSRLDFYTNLAGISPVIYERDLPFYEINPRFIQWATENLIPAPDMQIGSYTARQLYDNSYKRFARLMAQAYLYTQTLNIEEESAAYMEAGQNEEFYGPTYLETTYGKEAFDEAYEFTYDDYTGMSPYHAIGFWLRRHLDGSSDAIWAALQEVLRQYDPEGLNELKALYQ